MNIKTNRISINEVHVTDPQSGGTWRIISPHPISEEGALMAVEDTIREKNIGPEKDSVLTVEYEIRVAEEGETCHPVFQDILSRLEQLMSDNRDQESDGPKTDR